MVQADRLLLRSSPSEDTTPEMGILLGHALAMDHRRVVIAQDLMKSSTMMKKALIAGLVSSGTDVVDLGCTSIPVIAMMARMGDCAVYVTEYREYGLMSGYILLNPNGSMFRKDQIRHLDKIFTEEIRLPDYRHLGSVSYHRFATEEYNKKLLSVLGRDCECSLVLDCNCGTSSDSAPQVLNAMGADMVSINAQRDMNYTSRSLMTTDAELRDLRQFIESGPGMIGVVLNRVGTLLTVLDEKGQVLDDETVLALLVMYLRPRRMVVPVDTTSLVEDAFWGRTGVWVDTPHPKHPPEERLFIRAVPGAGTVCEEVANNDADLGYYDGGFIFGNVSMMSDGIHAAAVLAELAGGTSLEKTVASRPEYHRDSETYHYECTQDEFSRMMEENLPSVKSESVLRIDGWRVNLEGGWFLVRFDRDSEDTVTVTAESRDRAYLIGIMEVAGVLVESCAKGQLMTSMSRGSPCESYALQLERSYGWHVMKWTPPMFPKKSLSASEGSLEKPGCEWAEPAML